MKFIETIREWCNKCKDAILKKGRFASPTIEIEKLVRVKMYPIEPPIRRNVRLIYEAI